MISAQVLQPGESVAVFIGIQSGAGLVPDFPLFNLTRPVGIYPAGATISTATLERLGYSAPAMPTGGVR